MVLSLVLVSPLYMGFIVSETYSRNIGIIFLSIVGYLLLINNNFHINKRVFYLALVLAVFGITHFLLIEQSMKFLIILTATLGASIVINSYSFSYIGIVSYTVLFTLIASFIIILNPDSSAFNTTTFAVPLTICCAMWKEDNDLDRDSHFIIIGILCVVIAILLDSRAMIFGFIVPISIMLFKLRTSLIFLSVIALTVFSFYYDAIMLVDADLVLFALRSGRFGMWENVYNEGIGECFVIGCSKLKYTYALTSAGWDMKNSFHSSILESYIWLGALGPLVIFTAIYKSYITSKSRLKKMFLFAYTTRILFESITLPFMYDFIVIIAASLPLNKNSRKSSKERSS